MGQCKSDDELSCLYGDTLELMASCVRPNRGPHLDRSALQSLQRRHHLCVGANGKVNKGEDRSRGVIWTTSSTSRGSLFVIDSQADWHHLGDWHSHVYPSVGFAMQQLGFRILNDIIWEKPAPPQPGLPMLYSLYRTNTLGYKAQKGKERYTFNYEAMKSENGDKQMKNVWRMPAPSNDENSTASTQLRSPSDSLPLFASKHESR